MKNKIELHITKPELMNWYVNVYQVYRAYGGPEEGGWWYNEGTLLDCQLFDYWGEDDLKGNKQRQRAIAYAEHIKTQLEKSGSLECALGSGEHDGVNVMGEGDDSYLMRGGAWGEGKYVIEVSTQRGEDFPKERPHYE